MLTLLVACIPPEEDPLAPRDYPADTPMGRIQQAGVLVAGVEPGPPWAQADPQTGALEGFVVELAEAVAAVLGVELDLVEADAADLLDMADDGRADITFPRVPITEEAARRNDFTNPYWVGHQRLLVPRGSAVTSADELDGTQVCQFADETAGADLADLNPSAEIDDVDSPGDCLAPLAEGRVEAVAAFDVVLVGLMARLDELDTSADEFEIAGEQMATAGYGAVVEQGAPQYVRFVNTVFGAVKSEGLWQRAYARWLEPYLRTALEPPSITVEEAASLHPVDV